MNKNKRLKIGLFIDNFYPAIDGVVIAVDNIARELSENNDVVYFTGKVTDRNYLSALYLRSNLLLFPSLMDTSSLVRIEAAVNETPGLFITDSLVGKMIKDDYNGFNSKMDVNTYEKRIIEVISDKKLLTKVGKNAKKTLGISWKEVSNQIYKLYLKTLKK